MVTKQFVSTIIGLVASVTVAYGAGEDIVTSKSYVDHEVATKQAKIPAAGANGVGAGDTVITYTGTSGEIGERALYTDSSNYDSASDADKLITGAALNGAFTNLPTTNTTKLTCANPGTCNLWNITTQTAYGIPPFIFSPDVTIDGTNYCYRLHNRRDAYRDGTCSSETITYLGSEFSRTGNWGVVFPYGDVSGRSVCSDIAGESQGTIATEAQSATLDSQYTSQVGGAGAPRKNVNCWCKMENPVGASWVFKSTSLDSSECAERGCATGCAYNVQVDDIFRGAVFGVAAQ